MASERDVDTDFVVVEDTYNNGSIINNTVNVNNNNNSNIETSNDATINVNTTSFEESTKDQPDWIAPDPATRPTLFSGGGEDPLAQLDLYCRSHFNYDTNNSNNDNYNALFQTIADADELLSVAEFLFGLKALKAALAIVDSRRSLVTKLVAPSGRSLHTIRSSLSKNNNNNNSAPSATDGVPTNNNNNNGDENGGASVGDRDHYLCLLSQRQSSRSLPPIRYCSCRSFLEKSTRKVAALTALRTQGNYVSNSNNNNNTHAINANANANDENCHDGPPICKHLLALSLLPHLVAASESSAATHSYKSSSYNRYSYSYPEIKSITEHEFAGFILDRVL